MTDVTWSFTSIRPIGGDPSRGFLFDLATDTEGYGPGGRGVDPEEAALVADYLGLKGFEQAVGKSITVPASMSSPAAVFDLLVERANSSKRDPESQRRSEVAEWYARKLFVVPGVPMTALTAWWFIADAPGMPLLVRLILLGGVAGVAHLIVGLGLTVLYGTDEKPRFWMFGIFFWAFLIEVVVVLVRSFT
jgi:hypothetical protein